MQVILRDVNENREQWKQMRTSTVGSSEIATVCGLNRYQTPLGLWLQKTGRTESDFNDSDDRAWLGHEIESIIGRAYSRSSGVNVSAANCIVAHPTESWATASPDFFKVEPNGSRADWYSDNILGAVECKNVGHRMLHHWEDDNVPDAAHCQLIWQLGCCALPSGTVAALLGGRDFVFRDFDYDASLMQTMLDVAGEFVRCLQSDTPPPAMAADRRVLDLMPRFDKQTDINPELISIVRAYEDSQAQMKDIRKKLKALEDESDGYRATLTQALGDSEHGKCLDYDISCVSKAHDGWTVSPGYRTYFKVKRIEN